MPPLDVFHPVDHPVFMENEYIIGLQERMQRTRKLMRARQTRARAEEGVVPLFKVGDRVRLKPFFKGKSVKLQPRLIGP